MIKELLANVISTLILSLLVSTFYLSTYVYAQAQTEPSVAPQNEDQRHFWTAQYCDIDYKDKPQNNATIMALCDTAMQYLGFFCADAALAMVEYESCDYLDGVVQTASKYSESRNLTTLDDLLYNMPKSEAMRFEKPTAADFESAFQQLYQIDGGKSEFELMINPDKPLIEREQPPTADIVEEEEQNDDNNNDNDNEEE